MDPGEWPQSTEKEGPFPLVSRLAPFLFGHIYNASDNEIQGQKFLELRSIIDCSSHDVSGEGWLNPGVSLFWDPPCSLRAVLLTSE